MSEQKSTIDKLVIEVAKVMQPVADVVQSDDPVEGLRYLILDSGIDLSEIFSGLYFIDELYLIILKRMESNRITD